MFVQDHVVAGVLLCKRDTFLERAEFMQLAYSAVGPSRPGLKDAAAVTLPVPSILKPRPLWTGKQVAHSFRVLGSFLRHLSPSLGGQTELRNAM